MRQIDVLLREGVDEIVIRQSRHRDHRRLVELGVVQPVQQVHAAGPVVARQQPMRPVHLACAQAMSAADSSCRTWMKRSCPCALADRLHEAIDAVSGHAEDGVDAPGDEGVDQQFGAIAPGGSSHCPGNLLASALCSLSVGNVFFANCAKSGSFDPAALSNSAMAFE